LVEVEKKGDSMKFYAIAYTIAAMAMAYVYLSLS